MTRRIAFKRRWCDAESLPKLAVSKLRRRPLRRGVTRTICLLKREELDCYASPGYAAILQAKGITPALVDIFQPGATEQIEAAAKVGREVTRWLLFVKN